MPDATCQVGMKHKLPIIAQWGYNCGLAKWLEFEKKPGNHFTYASHARGYGLGAHVGRLIDDMFPEPMPKDLGYLFPRQFPLWSTTLHDKDGKELRTTTMVFHADGTQVSDYRIEVGEWPSTVGVPIMVKSAGKVTAVATRLSGWPKLLPEGAEVTVSLNVDAGAEVLQKARMGKAIQIGVGREAKVIITGPEVALPAEAGGEKVPFRAEFTLTPEKPGQAVEVTVLRGTVPYKYTLAAPVTAPAK